MRAKQLVEKYGTSSLDYFKTYADKRFWFSDDGESFVAFKTSRKYAIALESPVGPHTAAITQAIVDLTNTAGETDCARLTTASPKCSFRCTSHCKRLLPIGDEAVANLETFTTDGKEKKAMRNTK